MIAVKALLNKRASTKGVSVDVEAKPGARDACSVPADSTIQVPVQIRSRQQQTEKIDEEIE